MLLALALALAPPSPATPLDPLHYESTAVSAASQSGDAVTLDRDAWTRLTVPVRLGSDGPFRFLVDTGSDRTAISRELANRLRLAKGASATVHSSTEASDVGIAFVPELSFSRTKVYKLRAPVLAATDLGADGLLGLDSLRARRVLFDFRAGSLAIDRDAALDTAETDVITVLARRRDGRLIVTDAEAENVRVAVVLDTGSQYSIGNQALRRRLERQGAIERIEPITLLSVTGQPLHGELARIRTMRIGGAALEGVLVVFADAHTFGALRLNGKPALLLGMNTLAAFDQVGIDFAKRRLTLVMTKGRRT